MKTKRIVQAIPCLMSLIVLASFYSFNSGGSGVTSATGQASSVGSLGELGTCSRGGGALCHASSVGGLADNAGPGSVVLTSVPVISGSNYVPGQLYHMTITVSETGKTRFGFGCEILDNSGNTDGRINNTAGTVTITDVTNTRIWQAYGSGRLSVTHTTAGGFSTNTASFNFDWKAPASGTVNFFIAGNATNNNTKADAADNVYLSRPILTPLVTATNEKDASSFTFSAYPVPARDVLHIDLNFQHEQSLTIGLYNVSGRLIRTFEKGMQKAGDFKGSYALYDLPRGMYILKINSGTETLSRAITVQ
jgi:hypothetical protein